MAAPNILNLTTSTGKTAVVAVGTSATTVVANAASSGKVLQIQSLIIANVDGAASADITVDVYRSSTAYRVAYTVAVANDKALVVISANEPIYLEEGDTLRATASASGDLEAVCGYLDLS